VLIKLRGDRFKSYAEKFIPAAIFSRQYLGNLFHNLRLFLANDFHMEAGKKHLIESFYRAIAEQAPDPIPHREILLTAWIMDQIFNQISGLPGLSKEILSSPSSAIASGPVSAHFGHVSHGSISESDRHERCRQLGSGRIIINADDWGRSALETDSAQSCWEMGRVTSVSAMVFMKDSERAAELARNRDLDVGLHLNLSEEFTGPSVPNQLSGQHGAIVRFLSRNKYSLLIYNPFLRKAFRDAFNAQMQEFHRLYGKPPSHIDGHRHRHLCTNMLLGEVIPRGANVRRSFSFQHGEKGALNLGYRKLINNWLARRYSITDHFFSLHYSLEKKIISRVSELARTSTVELMTHPKNAWESAYLQSDKFLQDFAGVQLGNFSKVKPASSKTLTF
jgi:predicted glycoside hydrolase/deacetylase ChbG (UPF0249 family)